MIISVLLSCAVIAICLYYYFIHLARFRRLINRIPGPKTIPFFGDTLNFCRSPLEEMINIMISRFREYGPFYRVWMCTIAYISISHPDDVQTVMSNSKYNTKGFAYKLFYPWLRDGLLLSKGIKWHERRKILTPTFHFNILKRFSEIIFEECNHMIKQLKNMEDSTVKDLTAFFSHHMLNTISGTAMGISLRDIDAIEQEKYRNAIRDIGEIIAYRFLRPWYYSNIIFAMSSKYKKQAECLKILHDFTDKIIAERRRYHKSTGGQFLNLENDAEANGKIGRERLAMLDFLILASNNNQISDVGIREEVDTFLFEGHDTTAMAVSFATFLLAAHKDVQDRVRNEVNAVMEENGGKLTMAALQNMPYTERCMKETLRLYPSVYMIQRSLEEDVILRSYQVPAGTQLHIDILNIHRNPEFWPNPEVFDPDRFLPELVKIRHPYAYIPFSAGSRNCIGQRLAMMEMKATIGILVHNFQLEPVDDLKDVKLLADIIIRTINPLRVKLVPLKKV